MQDLETNLEFLLRLYQRALMDHWPRPIASISMEMESCQNQPVRAEQSKSWEAQIRSLRVLANAVKEAGAITKRDELNFEHPKTLYLFDELLKVYKQAIHNQLGKNSSELAHRLILEFQDLIAMKEPELRRHMK